jgi:hypothetical protein
MERGPWVYRPNHPSANENGMVPKSAATPMIRPDAPMVISDLPEYRASAVDKMTGKRPMIGGRRQHREFLQANGYREIGNEMPAVRREQLSQGDRVSDIRRALRDS